MAFNLLRKTGPFRLRSSQIHWRTISTSKKQHELDPLDQWIASPPTHTLTDSLNVDHLSDLYITLPTRDGSRKPYQEPQPGTPLPFGHHLAFFHPRKPESLLRTDGTDEEFSPPSPFSKRMWAGGKMTWDTSNPLIIGKRTKSVSTVMSAEKKGFEKGNPMVFVTQNIQFTQEGKQTPSVTEERAHVYFNPEASSKQPKKFDREGEYFRKSLWNHVTMFHTSARHSEYSRLYIQLYAIFDHPFPLFCPDIQCTPYTSRQRILPRRRRVPRYDRI